MQDLALIRNLLAALLFCRHYKEPSCYLVYVCSYIQRSVVDASILDYLKK